MRGIRLLVALTALLAMLVGGGTALAAQRVLVVRAEESAAVDEFVGGLRQQLAGRATIDEQRLGDAGFVSRPAAEARLIVPVGVKALRAVVAAGGSEPVLAALVPRSAYERIVGAAEARRVSAVFLDQPLLRQLALIDVALPGRRHVGVLVGPESRTALVGLRRPAERFDLTVQDREVDSERQIAAALEGLVGRVDVLLALPDPLVHNAGTIQSILLASYRQRVPVVGFSPAYTRAGALMSLHSSPTQLADQVADQVLGVLASGRLGQPQHPRDYLVSVNRQVARSLAIDLPDEPTLLQRVKQRAGE